MKVVLVDSSAFIYKYFYAFGKKDEEFQKNCAIYGFINMLITIMLNDEDVKIYVCFDSANNFRTDLSDSYKAQRKTCPEFLIPQFKSIKEIVTHLGLHKVKLDGYEADDVIATLAHKFQADEKVEEITILSPDKDIIQLLPLSKVHIFKDFNTELDEEYVMKKFHVSSEMFTTYQALVGDSCDNIKGVKGIGPKTAVKLINSDKVVKCPDFLLSFELVTLKSDLKLKYSKNNLETDFPKVCTLLDSYNLKNLSRRIKTQFKNFFP